MTKSFKTVLLKTEDNILTVTLNRPDKRNALNDRMVKEMVEILSTYKAEHEISVMILTGAGSAFCAGADLAYLKALLEKDREAHRQDSDRLSEMFGLLYDFPKPVIAMVNGPAIGGGCGLVTVCDFAFASAAAKFGYPEVRIGFVPAIVSVFLMSSLGERKAKELLLTGKILDAAEALSLGLVNGVAPDQAALFHMVNEVAEMLRQNAPSSLRFTKTFCNRINFEKLDHLLAEAAALNAESRLHKNFREGILSFLEKRKPVWIR